MGTVRVLGCSDAFNSGGRFFPCFYVESDSARFLIDCGPTALLAMKRSGLDPDALDAVLISHFHGDHIGGLPFLELELGILRKRTRPLLIAGPPEVEARTRAVVAALYPGRDALPRIPFQYFEYSAGEVLAVGGVRVQGFPVVHTPESRPHAIRVEVDGKVIAYSGDTEWTDALVAVADGADLFICEATTFEVKVESHLSLPTILAHRAELRCRRLLVTHMSDDVLSRLPIDGVETAADGALITF
jgi:ribonuclease BN (tRNA processing enzyme)